MAHHNQDRVLTLVVQIKNPEQAQQLWDAHGKGELLAGCQIKAIGNGDKFSEFDRLNELVGEIQEYLERHLGDDAAEDLLDKIEAFDNPPLAPLTPEQQRQLDAARKVYRQQTSE